MNAYNEEVARIRAEAKRRHKEANLTCAIVAGVIFMCCLFVYRNLLEAML